jgi:hypothetical protein
MSCSKLCEPSASDFLHGLAHAGKIAFLDQVGHQGGVEQHLHGRHAAAGVGAQQALRDHGAQAAARSPSMVGRTSTG